MLEKPLEWALLVELPAELGVSGCMTSPPPDPLTPWWPW
jgi:hypothetical protein